jgi:hypothetical protein
MTFHRRTASLALRAISLAAILGGSASIAIAGNGGPCPTNGKRCHGTVTYPNGAVYVGEFRDGEKSGQGTLSFPSGATYVGGFRDDEKSGQGTYTWPSGAMYVGEFRDDEKSGRGALTMPNGARYVGEFREDVKNGRGTLYNLSGIFELQGNWKDDQFVGAD